MENKYWKLTDSENSEIKNTDMIKPPLTDFELKMFNLDENDLSLIKIIKIKLVKMQLYETAVKVRDLEKEITNMIEYAELMRGKYKVNTQADSMEFGVYLVNHFTPFRLTNGDIKGYSKIEEKMNSEIDAEAEVKIYNIDQVYNFYQIHRVREALKG